MRYLTPIPKQFVDQSGIPYSDGTVSVYLSGSDELADIFEDAEGDALCPNPCRLDSNGAWQCFVPGDIPLDYIVQDKHGNVVFPYYNIVPASGDGAVFTVKGTEGEIKVTNRATASGRREATVGLDTAFKQRVDQVEDDIGDLNEEMRGVEGSIQELNEDVDHLDDRVEEAEGQIGQLSESLAEKKDRQTPVVVGSIPPNKTVKRISQDANGKIDVETQDIEFPGADLVNISSPEGTLEVSKTTQTGRQDFDMDVADHSLETKKMKVDQFHYLDVDGTTMSSITEGHTTILSSLDVVVTTSSTYDTVKGIIDNGKHPVLSDSGVFYRLVGTPAGSIVDGVARVSYDFACFPSGEVVAGEKYEAKVYNLDVSLGWRVTKQFYLYTASKADTLLAGKQGLLNQCGDYGRPVYIGSDHLPAMVNLWHIRAISKNLIIEKPLTDVWEDEDALFELSFNNGGYSVKYLICIRCSGSITAAAPFGTDGGVYIYMSGNIGVPVVKWATGDNDTKLVIGINVSSSNHPMSCTCLGKSPSAMYFNDSATITAWTDVPVKASSHFVKAPSAGAGSTAVPIYIDSDGVAKECSSQSIVASALYNYDVVYRFNQLTVQWVSENTADDVRLLYAENNCVNTATIELSTSHPTLCYVLCTLPELYSNSAYGMSFEIAIRAVGVDASGSEAVLIIDSAENNYTMLGEFSPDGQGEFLNMVQNRMRLPAAGMQTTYKVFVDGHSYRVVRVS